MLGDATILALPINWPDTGHPIEQTPLVAVLVQAAASQNKLIIAAADRNKLNEIEVLVVDVEVPTNRKLGPRNDVRTVNQ